MNEDITTSSISSDISSYKTSEDISDEKIELVDDDNNRDAVDIDYDNNDNNDDNDDDDKGIVDDNDINDDDEKHVDNPNYENQDEIFTDNEENSEVEEDEENSEVEEDEENSEVEEDEENSEVEEDEEEEEEEEEEELDDDDILTSDDYILTDEIVESINVLYIRNIKDIINNNELFITHTHEQIFDGFNTLLDDGILAQGATKLHSEVMNTKLNTNNIYIYTKDVHKSLELSEIINKTKSNNYKASQRQKWILLNSIEQYDYININLKMDKLYKIIHDKYIYPTRFLTNEFSHLSTYSYKLQYVTYVNDYETLMSRVLGSAFFKVEKEYSIDDNAEINLKDYIMPITSINEQDVKDCLEEFTLIDNLMRRYNKSFYSLNVEDHEYIKKIQKRVKPEKEHKTQMNYLNISSSTKNEKYNEYDALYESLEIYTIKYDENLLLQDLNTKLNDNKNQKCLTSLKEFINSEDINKDLVNTKETITHTNVKHAINVISNRKVFEHTYDEISKNILKTKEIIKHNEGKWGIKLATYQSQQYKADINEIKETLAYETNKAGLVFDEQAIKTNVIMSKGEDNIINNSEVKSVLMSYNHDINFQQMVEKTIVKILQVSKEIEIHIDIQQLVNNLYSGGIFSREQTIQAKIENILSNEDEATRSYYRQLILSEIRTEYSQNNKSFLKKIIDAFYEFENNCKLMFEHMVLYWSFQIIERNLKTDETYNCVTSCYNYWNTDGTPLRIKSNDKYSTSGPLTYILCEMEKILEEDDIYTKDTITITSSRILKHIKKNQQLSNLQSKLEKLREEKLRDKIGKSKLDDTTYSERLNKLNNESTNDNYVNALLYMPNNKNQKQIHKYVLGCCKQQITNKFRAFIDIENIDELSIIKETRDQNLTKEKSKNIEEVHTGIIYSTPLKPSNDKDKIFNNTSQIIINNSLVEIKDTEIFTHILSENSNFNSYFTEEFVKSLTGDNVQAKCENEATENFTKFIRKINKRGVLPLLINFNIPYRYINIIETILQKYSIDIQIFDKFRILIHNITQCITNLRASLYVSYINQYICGQILKIVSNIENESNQLIFTKIYENIIMESRLHILPTTKEYNNTISSLREERKLRTLAALDMMTQEERQIAKDNKKMFKDYNYIGSDVDNAENDYVWGGDDEGIIDNQV